MLNPTRGCQQLRAQLGVAKAPVEMPRRNAALLKRLSGSGAYSVCVQRVRVRGCVCVCPIAVHAGVPKPFPFLYALLLQAFHSVLTPFAHDGFTCHALREVRFQVPGVGEVPASVRSKNDNARAVLGGLQNDTARAVLGGYASKVQRGLWREGGAGGVGGWS